MCWKFVHALDREAQHLRSYMTGAGLLDVVPLRCAGRTGKEPDVEATRSREHIWQPAAVSLPELAGRPRARDRSAAACWRAKPSTLALGGTAALIIPLAFSNGR